MNILADVLTLSRGVLVLVILLCGLSHGIDALLTIVVLTIICWITDVLDGKFARQAPDPTKLGSLDLVMDLGLGLALAICFVAWGFLPLAAVIIPVLIVVLSAGVFRFYATQKFVLGLTYGALAYFVWQTSVLWGWIVLGSWGFLIILNPERTRQQVFGFLKEVGKLFQRKTS